MIAEEKKIWKIREQLEDLTEENYKQFNEKLLPGVKHIIGVRLPALRKIAKETAKSNYSEYLERLHITKSLWYGGLLSLI